MVREEEPRKSPRSSSFSQRSPNPVLSNGRFGENSSTMFSPRFKSVAAMAGWDEETLLIASLIVDDTPDREFKQRKRSDLAFKTPPSNSRRKRRDQRRSPAPIPATVLNLDEDESEDTTGKANETSKKAEAENQKKEIKTRGNEPLENRPTDSAAPAAPLPCLDRLREELSCAICLEICYEPSTTACGHSFCKKCLRSAAEKCGKRCPKCRQLISARSCTVNTVLWNTIQLLFPDEVKSRKASSRSPAESVGPETVSVRQGQRDTQTQRNSRSRIRPSASLSSSMVNAEILRRRPDPPGQDEDAALALRLQREEFMEVITGGEGGVGRRRRSRHDRDRDHDDGSRISLSLARENLRAMASRAISLRARGRHV
ncbi:E3 ubiquitin-protein ligase RNF168-like [Punica granatum]|uniref:RING-type E3 ubiquitin transferase n=1 Tax=Punica granatum TaxID=22663 RepID=A0A6P8EBJ7_PUNGR|nr:E3 ubiquitin-protein ligase RNF168-like [Punica granatum]